MKHIFNPEELSIMTKEERDFTKTYVDKLRGYAEGRVEGTQIKNLNAGMANVARVVQSRSAMAALKFHILKEDDQKLIEKMGGK